MSDAFKGLQAHAAEAAVSQFALVLADIDKRGLPMPEPVVLAAMVQASMALAINVQNWANEEGKP